ncbi:mucin-17-like [Mytilus californianus]|uniref:mucin-17-like n=1 Tax=Mytilus californianus TaxID=6549 RepID=UPI002246BE8E|nr:mucin-17-like [Mytilus californianus]
MFIGLMYDTSDEKFRWLDNEILTWAAWDSGEPNCMQGTNPLSNCQSKKENCVRLTGGYKLRTVDCKFKYYILCSKDIPTTTTPTTRISTTVTTTEAETSTQVETTTPVETTSLETTTFPETTTPVKTQSRGTTKLPETTTPVETQSQGTTSFPETTMPVETQSQGTTKLPETTTSSKTNAFSEFMISLETASTEYDFLSSRAEIASSYSKLLTTSTTTDTSLSPVIKSSTAIAMQCMCPKSTTSNKWLFIQDMNLTISELRKIVEEDFEKNIKHEITVNTNALSKTLRQKTSAPDYRKSSSSLGWLSITIITLPVVLMVSMDIINIFQKSED